MLRLARWDIAGGYNWQTEQVNTAWLDIGCLENKRDSSLM